jgi:hypothetical protein
LKCHSFLAARQRADFYVGGITMRQPATPSRLNLVPLWPYCGTKNLLARRGSAGNVIPMPEKQRGTSKRRSKRLQTRVNAAELAAFRASCGQVTCEPAHTLRALARALVEQVRRHGHVTLPIRIRE